MIRDEDAPKPRPHQQPTTSDRGAVDEAPEIEAVTTKRPSAKIPEASAPAPVLEREPTTKLADLVPAPGAAMPAMVTMALHMPSFLEDDAPVAPTTRSGTQPVSVAQASLDRATVSLRSGAQWLDACGHDRLAVMLGGMIKSLGAAASDYTPLEFAGARLVADLRRAQDPFTGEEIGTMLVQIARALGVDPCTRTMRKIANENEAKAKQYEARAAASGNNLEREQWLARANERRRHAIDLKKATR